MEPAVFPANCGSLGQTNQVSYLSPVPILLLKRPLVMILGNKLKYLTRGVAFLFVGEGYLQRFATGCFPKFGFRDCITNKGDLVLVVAEFQGRKFPRNANGIDGVSLPGHNLQGGCQDYLIITG